MIYPSDEWDDEPRCSVCGCTETEPCVDDAGGTCSWVDAERSLCSACDENLGDVAGVEDEPAEPGFYKSQGGLWLPR